MKSIVLNKSMQNSRKFSNFLVWINPYRVFFGYPQIYAHIEKVYTHIEVLYTHIEFKILELLSFAYVIMRFFVQKTWSIYLKKRNTNPSFFASSIMRFSIQKHVDKLHRT
ncbi:hypothetical protein GCM10007887_40620 [Methylobacterium haplocladii]|uniref:Uncharacterized protein n=2 Tax=Pseudomonadota TaxID=1224 RepID=A0ABQ6DES2_9HYPH|nr:hypothetical protein GCM10007884_50510 [Methylobacterium brachythecii]GLS61355.1 hypothetical protein GCM10007887_40620 [Methylobacterium haplocladii]GLT24643.1 hypothetical protein GCM10007933_41320 [Zoogloea oryzae]